MKKETRMTVLLMSPMMSFFAPSFVSACPMCEGANAVTVREGIRATADLSTFLAMISPFAFLFVITYLISNRDGSDPSRQKNEDI